MRENGVDTVSFTAFRSHLPTPSPLLRFKRRTVSQSASNEQMDLFQSCCSLIGFLDLIALSLSQDFLLMVLRHPEVLMGKLYPLVPFRKADTWMHDPSFPSAQLTHFLLEAWGEELAFLGFLPGVT